MFDIAVYQKAWRATKTANGVCDRCGKRKIVKGIKKCRVCRQYRSGFGSTIKDIKETHRLKAVTARQKAKKCDICEKKYHNGRGWHIDHCHKTKKFRGILCSNCNTGLGQFMDDVTFLRKALNYLRKNR